MGEEVKTELKNLTARVDTVDKTLLAARIYLRVASIATGAFGLSLASAIGYLLIQFGNIDSKARSAREEAISNIRTAQTTAVDLVSRQVESFRLLAVPIGTVLPFAGPVSEDEVEKPDDKLAVRAAIQNLETNGWLVCDGRPLTKAAYPALYAKLGQAHGGGFDADKNRTGDFNLPDYRGTFLRGVDHGQSRDPDRDSRTPAANGGNSGARVGSMQPSATAIPSTFKISGGSHTHTHYLRKNGSEDRGHHTGAEGSHWPGSIYLHEWNTPVKGAGEHEHKWTGDDKETRPRNAYVNFLIRAH